MVQNRRHKRWRGRLIIASGICDAGSKYEYPRCEVPTVRTFAPTFLFDADFAVATSLVVCTFGSGRTIPHKGAHFCSKSKKNQKKNGGGRCGHCGSPVLKGVHRRCYAGCKTKGLDFEDMLVKAVAMKLKDHGGVSGIQTFGGGRPVRIVIVMEGLIPEAPIDIMLGEFVGQNVVQLNFFSRRRNTIMRQLSTQLCYLCVENT